MPRVDPVEWASLLGLRPSTEGKQWDGTCPCCHRKHRFSQTLKNGKILWHCNGEGGCSQEQILAALAAIAPSWITAPRRPRKAARPADPDELITLILDRSVPDNALRLGLLRILGMTTSEAAEKLGMPKSTRYDALRNLGRNRR